MTGQKPESEAVAFLESVVQSLGDQDQALIDAALDRVMFDGPVLVSLLTHVTKSEAIAKNVAADAHAASHYGTRFMAIQFQYDSAKLVQDRQINPKRAGVLLKRLHNEVAGLYNALDHIDLLSDINPLLRVPPTIPIVLDPEDQNRQKKGRGFDGYVAAKYLIAPFRLHLRFIHEMLVETIEQLDTSRSPKRGRPRKKSLAWLVQPLADIYSNAPDDPKIKRLMSDVRWRRATVSYNERRADPYYGHFLEFVREFLKIVDPDISKRTGLGQTVRAITQKLHREIN